MLDKNKRMEDIKNKLREFNINRLESHIISRSRGDIVYRWEGDRLFIRVYDDMIENTWLDEKRISCENLNVYDRYILEFDCLLYNAKHPMLAPAFKLRVFDQDLNIVYDLQKKMYDVHSEDMHKRLWELKYWLSLDWEMGKV